MLFQQRLPLMADPISARVDDLRDRDLDALPGSRHRDGNQEEVVPRRHPRQPQDEPSRRQVEGDSPEPKRVEERMVLREILRHHPGRPVELVGFLQLEGPEFLPEAVLGLHLEARIETVG